MSRSNKSPPVVVWFRQDLRLADNPALSEAARRGPVIPLFIWAPEEELPWTPGAASRWWLHQSLASLDRDLRQVSAKLILRQGPTIETLKEILSETGAKAVFWNRRYEPLVRARDERVVQALAREDLESQTFNAALLHEPWTIKNQAGKPFQVFTPFWRHCLSLSPPPEPLPPPSRLTPLPWQPRSMALADLKLEPTRGWAAGLRASWRPGERGAAEQLDRFLEMGFSQYTENRNRPDLPGTSRLSPHLHFGEISPRRVWHAVRHQAATGCADRKVERPVPGGWLRSQFIAELGWREFAHHLLHHYPHTDSQPLRPEFGRLRWRLRPDWLKAWQKGRTGFPLVDAGMRELWHTGWMHNRVRMVAASFLVKDLLIPWQEGARWFWDTLVDADLAQNTLGWQWTAGCGADAAPFFRVFNPIAQAQKFDPEGVYIRRWIPELREVSGHSIHEPHRFAATPHEPESTSGSKYPPPIVSHAVAREVALEAYKRIRS